MTKKETNKHPNWHMTAKERKWYYIGDTGRMFGMQVLSNFLTVFLMFQGINPASVATAVLIVKMIDALDDVVFGFIIDRFNPSKSKILSKFAGKGKYMPWYRTTFWTFPMATIFFFLMPRGMKESLKIVWLIVFYLIWDLTCTLSEVPMNSMVVTLTDIPEERNHILTVKGVITVIAAVGITIVWQFLISEVVGFSITSVAIVSSIIFLLMMAPMCTKVNEHNVELKNVVKESEEEKYSIKDMFKCVLTNKYIFIYFASTLISTILSTQLTLQVFTAFYIFHDSNMYSYIMLIGFIPGIVLSAMCGKFANKLGKRNLLLLIMGMGGTAMLIQHFLRGQSMMVFIILGGVCAIPNALSAVARTYIAPDTIEYTRYKTGKDCSGIFYALNSFISKATGGIAASLGLFILSLSGWKAVQVESFAELAKLGVVQNDQALNALWNCSYLLPAIGSFMSVVILLLYNLKDKDAELMAQCNSGTITREECESGLSRKY